MIDKAKDTRQKILLASIDEFALHGYMNGNLDNVVTRAEVSKGLIFHYFTNKMNLYKECVVFSLDALRQKIKQSECFKEKDIFDRLLKILDARLQLMRENYNMNLLVENLASLPDIEKYKEITDIFDGAISKMKFLLLNDLDFSEFKESFDKELVTQFMFMFMQFHDLQMLPHVRKKMQSIYKQNGIREQDTTDERMIKDAEIVFDKVKHLIEILKYGVYKAKTPY